MRQRRPLVAEEDSTRDLWPSFTDLVSTTALILFVLVLLAYFQNLISGKRLEAYRLQISDSEHKLRFLDDRVRKTSAEVEAGQIRLKLSELELARQRDIIAESNRELGSLRARLEGIALLRLDVLNRVKQSVEAELGSRRSNQEPLVRIGDNGNIIINESLVFEYNSHTIKPEGKPLLDTLAKGLGHLLADPTIRSNIDVVMIQGHTDERGSSSFNRELSSRRANAVLNYMFDANPVLEETYGSHFGASAYSEFRPLSTEKSDAGYAQNRRIEISLVLRDSQVREVIDEYMERVDPALQGPTPP